MENRIIPKEDCYAILSLINSIQPKFSKDGDRYCFLLGKNAQEGIAGFGVTGMEAAFNFFSNFMGCKEGEYCIGHNNIMMYISEKHS